jgi:hypothetical protein
LRLYGKPEKKDIDEDDVNQRYYKKLTFFITAENIAGIEETFAFSLTVINF